ncbi:50S ribosomal protein L5 [Candidatus Cerribacteria bacterium 'Amazon FNV 2010 28 9']|uniref:Large ribosomal subunit protein uL5 n=1 Tax=Candidatus Cerribacteria bacterium 'Amazon FNV 2010 28 9' TaxID=2081795 RepID=A0A317JNP2_9BACT|nr:MAG: 50S ribosomal protein L5 [Candidatus Cerribacteria bacterium 'Amazon FNV 2010 28 9']
MNRLQEKYQKEVIPTLEKEFGKTNIMAVTKPVKIVVNVGINKKENADASKFIESMTQQLMTITGQKPKVTAARKSIAGFKIRQGDAVGLCVTLRGNLMWEFFDKLTSIVLPRMKDFQGVKRATDKTGNYNLGFTEQIVFPEIEYDKINKISGLQVTIVNSGSDPKEALRMLELLGMPFEKAE